MDNSPQHGYLVLADISGFTAYLAGVELEHAHEILTDLMEIIIGQLKPRLTIAKLEGDAVFAYVPETQLPRGETMLELLETTYVAFRDRREGVHRRTTCECNACRAITSLDLKFIVHYGAYMLQPVGGALELLGSDVNLAHRLMKNHVAEVTGWRAYALFSAASLRQMQIPAEGAHPQGETYEHLGEITTYSFDLHSRYTELVTNRRVVVGRDQAGGQMVFELNAPPIQVWDWLNEPHLKKQWENLDTIVIGRPGGRTRAGAKNHCAHGKNVEMFETVLDWRPFDYFTVERAANGPPIKFTITYFLEPLAEATHTRLTVYSQMHAPLPRFLLPTLCRAFIRLRGIDRLYATLIRLVNAEAHSVPAITA